jgi:3-dehydroquinate dehydratase-2
MKLAIVNGPNLNLLGEREPEIYGSASFDSFLIKMDKLQLGIELNYFQSNVEGELINYLQVCKTNNIDGIILNAAAYTHTSIAIADTIAAIQIPTIEVHISNVLAREEYRKTSYIASKCIGSISGLGIDGYELAIQFFIKKFNK